ncbi:MAG: hypothetical protein RRB12_04400 [Armatimonadota bacterium]|nr:hypothetical protein [Armatimonadota bacterium]
MFHVKHSGGMAAAIVGANGGSPSNVGAAISHDGHDENGSEWRIASSEWRVADGLSVCFT